MQTHQLKRNTPNRKRMIVARGGKRGKTAGRGGKGQSARAGNKRRPEWRDIIKRVPKLRGRGKNSNKGFAVKPIVINLDVLEANFSANGQITPMILVEKGIIETRSGKIPRVKILGEGEITKALKVTGCELSVGAFEKVKKAGGSAPEFVMKPEPEKTVPKVEEAVKTEKKEKSEKATKVTKEAKKEAKEVKSAEKKPAKAVGTKVSMEKKAPKPVAK